MHIDAQGRGTTYAPLVFTTANVNAMGAAVRMRASVTFELPPAAIT